MARKRDEPPGAPVVLTQDVARAKEALADRIRLGNELAGRQATHGGEMQRAKADIEGWRAYNVALLERIFTTDEIAREYSWAGHSGSMAVRFGPPSMVDEFNSARHMLKGHLDYLESLLNRLDLYAPVSPHAEPPTQSHQAHRAETPTRAFVVHGQNEAIREAVARLLEKAGIQAVILHEQANRGDTIIEKLERNSDVHFAVVLLTKDDEGHRKGDIAPLQARARQNVILELGYFVGRLGRKNVCALYEDGVELPSDWNGVVWVALDVHDAWKYKLARELNAGGFSIDLNHI